MSPVAVERGQEGRQPFQAGNTRTKSNAIEVPTISLPSGGGAIRGIDEKFSVNAVNGTAGFSIPLPTSSARGFGPELGLSYNTGAGNGVFGMGWSLGISRIARKTDKRLPRYQDAGGTSGIDSDTFVLSGAEDLVAEFQRVPLGGFVRDSDGEYLVDDELRNWQGVNYRVRRYRPRIEGLFARIERWWQDGGVDMFWRTISRDNVTSFYGLTSAARIADPEDASRIFEWLLEFTSDDKGNCTHHEYVSEDLSGMPDAHHNRNRSQVGNRYLKRVLHGNKVPYLGGGKSIPTSGADYHFETILDYGEHATEAPCLAVRPWDFREDAFSDYRAGFEVRTARLCRRVLLYHHFPELPGGSALVRSVDFSYGNNGLDGFTFLMEVASRGYLQQSAGVYSSRSLPPMAFEYQVHEWDMTVRELARESLPDAPAGTEGSGWQFVDLYAEGLEGILTEQGGGWYYKDNLGGGRFAPAKSVSPKPSFRGLGGGLQLLDLAGDGQRQLVQSQVEPKGYWELGAEGWQRFQSFQTMPTVAMDGSLRMMDLDGDGLVDILLAEPNGFTWFPSRGKQGYGQAQRVAHSQDEELAPAIVFMDGSQSIFLGDMSGDGLIDIVRIRNGEVCYWPNLGYGRFGAKVSLDNTPRFDSEGRWDPSRILLADIDGSGTSDLVYLGQGRFTVYLNRQGNRLADPVEVGPFPEVHGAVQVDVADLLGTGLSCIVWNSGLPKDAHHPTRYIDLLGSKKPHLMTGYRNNLGMEVLMAYTPSTKYYLEDREAGRPWATKLHFPVHCLSRTETRDGVTGARFVSSYTYHHGYYDHAEREFRGFGRVDQVDTEEYDRFIQGGSSNVQSEPLHQAPVLTRTWSHTGADIAQAGILRQMAGEYWHAEQVRQGYAVSHPEVELDDAMIVAAPGLDPGMVAALSTGELKEARRACKGMGLRSEVFALDAPQDPQLQLTPYTVATHNCKIELLQPRGRNPFAVYVVKESEAITYSYERNPSDPRVAHTLNLKLDELGNVLEAATVVYPRQVADAALPLDIQEIQGRTLVTVMQNRFTGDVAGPDALRLRLPAESSTYELRGLTKSGPYFTLAELEGVLEQAMEIPYESDAHQPPPGQADKRLIERVLSTYLAADLRTPLPVGEHDLNGLPCESYQLAYTSGLLTHLFGNRVDGAAMIEGRFTHLEGDENWWIRSGTAQYLEVGESVADAEARFFLPVAFVEPFGAKTKVEYDPHHLAIVRTEDALHNASAVDVLDYRTLSPRRMRDANQNLSEVLLDELGMVKASAVMGKGNEADRLDGLSGTTSIGELQVIQDFLHAADSAAMISLGKQLLQGASMRYVYDLEAFMQEGKPVVAASIARERHFAEAPDSPVQIALQYSDGMGKVAMQKVQAEPGPAKQVTLLPGGQYSVALVDTGTQLRWLGNGRTVLNNKGNAVMQYEPYFSVTPAYEDLPELVETGVTPVVHYDALGRAVRTEMPDGTLGRVEFDSWAQAQYDPNDTVLESDWYLRRTDAEHPRFIADPQEHAAALKAAAHADTPQRLHLDALGRPVLQVAHNHNALGEDVFQLTRAIVDIEGNLRKVIDARGNAVEAYSYDMLGQVVQQTGLDSGLRWRLSNAVGLPLRVYDEREHVFHYSYDILHRPLTMRVTGGDVPGMVLDHVYERLVYGEGEPGAEAANLRGKVVRHYDTAGMISVPAYDFKGHPLSTTRRLLSDYKGLANWTEAVLESALEAEAFSFVTETDALGRVIRQEMPDGSEVRPGYGLGGMLQSQSATLAGPEEAATFIQDIDYNEKGQRSRIVYGNGVRTTYEYDPETFRLRRLQSRRGNDSLLQDLHYVYDAAANITSIEDRAIATVYYDQMAVSAVSTYTYDALYRLIEATGRENDNGLSHGPLDNIQDSAYFHAMNPNDPMQARAYRQVYSYDVADNILSMQHFAGVGNVHGWTRNYTYGAGSNRLLGTDVGSEHYAYTHHAQHGFITAMPHLSRLAYNCKEEVIATAVQRVAGDNGTPETTYYQYDASGQRVRKVTELYAAQGAVAQKKCARVYLGGYEVFRQFSGGNAGLERRSLSLMDGGHRFCMVETRNGVNDGTDARLVRYQLHKHLGSASLELDGNAAVISYEEYHPYGTTAYQARNSNIRAAAKRYRFTGMERDEETGLSYHSARYYVPWLGRWLSADPIGIEGGMNVYGYVGGNPVGIRDTSGNGPNDGKQLWFSESPVYDQIAIATKTTRGFTKKMVENFRKVVATWGGPAEYDLGHIEKPFCEIPAGEPCAIRIQDRGYNRSVGATADKASQNKVRVDGVDTKAKGGRNPRAPDNPLFDDPAIRDRIPAKGFAKSPTPTETKFLSLEAKVEQNILQLSLQDKYYLKEKGIMKRVGVVNLLAIGYGGSVVFTSADKLDALAELAKSTVVLEAETAALTRIAGIKPGMAFILVSIAQMDDDQADPTPSEIKYSAIQNAIRELFPEVKYGTVQYFEAYTALDEAYSHPFKLGRIQSPSGGAMGDPLIPFDGGYMRQGPVGTRDIYYGTGMFPER